MTLQQFIEKWNGKYLDFDGAYGPQCVDLCRQYLIEVLQLPATVIKPVGGAREIYEKFDEKVDKAYFDKFSNTPSAIPNEGDIMLWGSGTYGHVAIFIEGDVNRFRSFDQNYPVGTPCHIQEHNYSSVLGWIRCKKDTTIPVETKVFENLVRKSTIYDKVRDKIGVDDSETIVLQEIDKLIRTEDVIQEKERIITEQNKTIEEIKKQAEEVDSQVFELSKGIAEAQKVNEDYKDEIYRMDKELVKYENQVSELKQKIEELKNTQPVENYNGWTLIKEGLLKLIGR